MFGFRSHKKPGHKDFDRENLKLVLRRCIILAVILGKIHVSVTKGSQDKAVHLLYWITSAELVGLCIFCERGSQVKQQKMGTGWGWKLAGGLLTAAAALLVLTYYLQTGWSHRYPTYVPGSAGQEITALLNQQTRSAQDYRTIFQQTGLSKTAVEDLLAQGEPHL